MATPYDVVTEITLHPVSTAERADVLAALGSRLPAAQLTANDQRTDTLVVSVRLEMVEDDASTAQIKAVDICQAAIPDAGLAGRAAAFTDARVEPPADPRNDPQA
jgi:hypothetical protein